MKTKGQVIIISLWMLVALGILAISVGHRVSLALKLNQYGKNKLKALYLAKAGFNRAIVDISADKTTDPEAKITLNDNKDEFAAAAVTDEQRKININTADGFLLLALLENSKADKPQEIMNNILIWRGEKEDELRVYEQSGYAPKKDKFANTEELLLVPGITAENYKNMKDLITVFGDGSININTVPAQTLAIVTAAIAKELSVSESSSLSLASKIIELRRNNGKFASKEEIKVETTGDEETNILNRLLEKITFQSADFLIEVTGNASKIRSKITSVYNRPEERILFWHEN